MNGTYNSKGERYSHFNFLFDTKRDAVYIIPVEERRHRHERNIFRLVPRDSVICIFDVSNSKF